MIGDFSNYKLVALVELGSDAGRYGALVSEGIMHGYSIETIVLWTKFAARAGNRALQLAGVTYFD